MEIINHLNTALKYELLNSRAKLQSARQTISFWDERVTPQDVEAEEQRLFGANISDDNNSQQHQILSSANDNAVNDEELWFVGQDDICDDSD